MTIALYVTEEMCARLGVVTGKGLSDLIREEFGFRSTFFVMVAGFFVDLANVVAEFAGVAEAMQVFGVSKYVSVPIAAVVVWVLVLRGNYRQVEKVFLVLCTFYLTYVVSAVMAKPDWLLAGKSMVIPNFQFNAPYLLMLTALVGTTIAPWQFFYMQASFVEKRIGARQYKQARADVLAGSITCMAIVFFIIVCTAATLYVFRTPRYHAGVGSRARLGAAGRALGRCPFRRRLAQRVLVCGLDPAALYRPCDLRRPGL